MSAERVAGIADQQDGLITRQQAIAAGLSKPAVRYAISSGGRWQVVLPGVYATFTGPLGQVHRLRAALLYGGAGAVISGATACRLRGLTYVPDAGNAIDVLVAHRCQRADTQFVRPRRTRRLPMPTLWVDADPTDTADLEELADILRRQPDHDDPLANGARPSQIPLAPVPRAAMDAVRFRRLKQTSDRDGRLPEPVERRLTQDTRALLCEVVQRRRTTTDDLVAELAAGAHRGAALAIRGAGVAGDPSVAVPHPRPAGRRPPADRTGLPAAGAAVIGVTAVTAWTHRSHLDHGCSSTLGPSRSSTTHSRANSPPRKNITVTTNPVAIVTACSAEPTT